MLKVTVLVEASESEADAVISAEAPLATFSAIMLASISASVGSVTENSLTSVIPIVNSVALVLESEDVDVM